MEEPLAGSTLVCGRPPRDDQSGTTAGTRKGCPYVAVEKVLLLVSWLNRMDYLVPVGIFSKPGGGIMKRREFFGRSLWGSLTAALAGAAPVRAREFPPG